MDRCPECGTAFPDPSMTECSICGWKRDDSNLLVNNRALYEFGKEAHDVISVFNLFTKYDNENYTPEFKERAKQCEERCKRLCQGLEKAGYVKKEKD